MQREYRQQNKNYADCPRPHCSRMVKLGVKRERANRQQDERDIRIHQEAKNFFLERFLKYAFVLADQI